MGIKTVCKKNNCCGCFGCIEVCPKGAISVVDNLVSYNSVIDVDKCISCGLCYKVCPNNNEVESRAPIDWKQGWASNETVRGTSASGGLAQAIAKAFVEDKGVVWSCRFANGKFVFSSATTCKEVEYFRGSKYIKSSTEGIYGIIREQLKAGGKVLFIGLPCQSAGLQNFIDKTFQDNLYTVDLICHGTPSPSVLKMYLAQSFGLEITEVGDIQFRSNDAWRLSRENMSLLPPKVMDRYTEAFLKGLSYTENCYNCTYAKVPRVSDISLGDSWGTELPIEEQRKGISLVLCQTSKGKELLEKAEVCLFPVDEKKAVVGNEQLQRPHIKPLEREILFKLLKQGKTFKRAMFFTNPKLWLKQDVKMILHKIGLFYRRRE